MVDEERGNNNVCGGGSCVNGGVSVPRVDTVKENGGVMDVETCSSSGLGGDGLRMYKRRKYSKVMEDGMVSDDSATQPVEKPMKHLSEHTSHRRDDALTISSNDCPLKHQRNIVLEELFQSLESEGGLRERIEEVLSFHPGSCSKTTVKESVRSCTAGRKCAEPACDGHHDVAEGNTGLTYGGPVNELNSGSVSDLCRHTFSEIILSEKFAELCGLFLQNGMKVNKLFDLSPISSRMKEKAYESSPMLFHSDVQQIWTKLQKVGTDIVALAKCLSDKTKASFHEQVGCCSAYNIPEHGRHEYLTQECTLRKPELPEARPLAHTCRHCGEKTDGINGLLCDSCEEIYHISCVKPAGKEIPGTSWHCTNCTEKGNHSTHKNCIACERLQASISSTGGESDLLSEQASDELEKGLNELVTEEGVKRFPNCKVCTTEVKNEEDYRICGHSFCPHKFYHVKCLTSKELLSHGPCWYCPSCLCRVCFTDQDDDKIVLCDGCDHAYHIYCMHPPRTTIPSGKWFCTKCDAGIQRVLQAKRSYQKMKNKSKKVKREDGLTKSGGVDMLLNAAKTLNYEENLAAMELKAK